MYGSALFADFRRFGPSRPRWSSRHNRASLEVMEPLQRKQWSFAPSLAQQARTAAATALHVAAIVPSASMSRASAPSPERERRDRRRRARRVSPAPTG